MKCKDCDCLVKGYFNSSPNTYVCTGVKYPFVVENIEQNCSQYPEKNKLWSWNENDSETWWHGTFDSKEEAIKDAIDTKNTGFCDLGDCIWIGECEYVPLGTYVDPDRIMEDLDELYCDETGCEDYIYDGVSDEDRKWLEDKLSELMAEFHKRAKINPGWFNVYAMEQINLNDYKELLDDNR